MIKQNILICGVVKNAAKYLEKSLALCIKTGELFANYKIIIYENNSTDDTKDILKYYIDKPNFVIIMEDISHEDIKKNSKAWAYTEITGSDHPCRMEQIANARNRIIRECKKQEYNDYKYVMFIDLDAEEWSLDGIIDSFDRYNEWDAIFANGLQGEENKYYDLFAYRNLNENIFGGEMLGEYNSPINYSKAIYISPNDANLKTVVSAFGGIGIYKKSLFTDDIQYGCLVTEQIISYYTTILSNTMRIDDLMLKIIAEPCPKFPGGYKTYFKYNNKYHTIHWKNNSGYDNVVLCEHVSVNIPLFFKGYRLRINPKMTYRWTG
jgi:hypothetical protein